MNQAITLNGIEKAVAGLAYANEKALKYRLIQIIRSHYEDDPPSASSGPIKTDDLVKKLWDTGDDTELIRNRRKNLSSVKSMVNADLERLYREGKNPEGIIIGPDNLFAMSNEAKDKMIQSIMGHFGADSLMKINDLLYFVDNFLKNRGVVTEQEYDDIHEKLNRLIKLIQKLEVQGSFEEQGLGTDLVPDVEGKLENIGEDAEIFKENVFLETEKDELETEEIEEGDEVLEEELEEVDEAAAEVEIIDKEILEDEVNEMDSEVDLIAGEEDEDVEDIELEGDFEEFEIEEDESDLVEIDAEEELAEVDAEDLEEAEEESVLELEEDEIHKLRILAEEFNSTLAAMGRYYNQYILIPAGEYVIGNKGTEKEIGSERATILSSFYMGKFSVTNALFEIFVDRTGYKTTAERLGYGTVYYGRYQKVVDGKTGLEQISWNSALLCKRIERAFWYQPFGPGSTLHNKRNHPVVQVSLEDAMAFAAWTGKRLPTEAEWEAAARTAKAYLYPWGNEAKTGACNLEESYIGDTTPVDMFLEYENAFGIADTLGNVFEWTLDRMARPGGNQRSCIIKGSSWVTGNGIDFTSRLELEPDSHSNILGFRCVAC